MKFLLDVAGAALRRACEVLAAGDRCGRYRCGEGEGSDGKDYSVCRHLLSKYAHQPVQCDQAISGSMTISINSGGGIK